jgi:hypothetical protein
MKNSQENERTINLQVSAETEAPEREEELASILLEFIQRSVLNASGSLNIEQLIQIIGTSRAKSKVFSSTSITHYVEVTPEVMRKSSGYHGMNIRVKDYIIWISWEDQQWKFNFCVDPASRPKKHSRLF